MSPPAFVYVAPARHEDILKIGFSHDPCARVRSFHERWFEYFDLDRGFVLAAMDEKDARRIERLLGQRLREHRAAHAPLVIEQAAGGFTEWYRSALAGVNELAGHIVAEGGYAPLVPLAACLHARLLVERDALFERCVAQLDAIDACGKSAQGTALRRGLRNILDSYTAMQIELRGHLPDDALPWLERHAT